MAFSFCRTIGSKALGRSAPESAGEDSKSVLPVSKQICFPDEENGLKIKLSTMALAGVVENRGVMQQQQF